MPVTHPNIVFIVVISLAIMALTYMGGLACCVVMNISAQPEIVQSFQAAGIFVLGALAGILSNVRTSPATPADASSKSSTQIVTKTETTNEPDPKDP